jgi:hypothetical protein
VDGYHEATITIPYSRIANSNSTPYTILNSPGSNRCLILNKAIVSFDPPIANNFIEANSNFYIYANDTLGVLHLSETVSNSNAFVIFSNTQSLFFKYTNKTGNPIQYTIANTIFNSTQKTYKQLNFNSEVNPVENAPIVVYLSEGVVANSPGNLRIKVYYDIINRYNSW